MRVDYVEFMTDVLEQRIERLEHGQEIALATSEKSYAEALTLTRRVHHKLMDYYSSFRMDESGIHISVQSVPTPGEVSWLHEIFTFADQSAEKLIERSPFWQAQKVKKLQEMIQEVDIYLRQMLINHTN